MLTLWRRHKITCQHKADRYFRNCRCAVWCEGMVESQYVRRSLKTRSWTRAEILKREIEDGGRTVKDVSVKVGKSESYVRQRLFLTNLSDKARKLYRSGDMVDSVAIVVARLIPGNQDLLLKGISSYALEHPDEMKERIEEHFSEPLKNQPWLKDKAAMEAVGACKECPPPRAALFGDNKDGACTDLRCCQRKMKAYFAWRVKENPELVLVSTMYGKSELPNVLSLGQYQRVKKTACDYATQALIAEGSDIGTLVWVCFDKDCSEHKKQNSDYQPSESEKAKRKKEREHEEARRIKFDASVDAALAKVKWPLSEKHLDALYELMFEKCGTASQIPIAKRHNIKAGVAKHKDYSTRDYEAPLRRLAEEQGKDGKLRMIFELLLPTYYLHGDEKDWGKQVAKL